MSFANLTDVEHEALAHLFEELSEAIGPIAKSMRHGMNSRHPNGSATNRSLIGHEIGNVVVAIEIAKQLGILSETDIREGADAKWRNVGRYLHHIDIDSLTRSARPKKSARARKR